MSNNRGKSAAERLLGAGKEDTNPTKATTSNEKELKLHMNTLLWIKNIEKLIKQQGNSKRNADSIRINPILANALKYWTSIGEPEKVNLMLSKKRFWNLFLKSI